MANPSCTTTQLIDNAACYRGNILSPTQQWALLVYANILQLAAIGGTDYRSVLTTTLLTDSACPPSTDDEIMAAKIAIAFNNAAAAGASVPADVNAALALANCLQYVPGGITDLKQIDLLLSCKLGVSKAYPQ